MAEMRSAVPSHRPGTRTGLGSGIAVHGDDGESVTGQREAANLGGAAVEHVEEHALALFYADRFAVAEHSAVDGEGVVADFVTVRRCLWRARRSWRFAGSLSAATVAAGDRKSIAISPPRLSVGWNSLSVRKTSRS